MRTLSCRVQSSCIARLIWLLTLALALQPLTWARQPAASWVSLPYCVGSAGPTQQAAARSGANTQGRAHHIWEVVKMSSRAAQWQSTLRAGSRQIHQTSETRAQRFAASGPRSSKIHNLWVLLNPTAVLCASGSPWAMPPAEHALVFDAPVAQAPAADCSAPHRLLLRARPQQPRAPPQVS